MLEEKIPTQPKGLSQRSSLLEERLETLRRENRTAFIGYMPFGFPTEQDSIHAMTLMVEHGVDIVEIGLPYSDPVMDGPVIQAASQIAIANGESITRVWDAVRAVAQAGGVPVIMSYWNLIVHYGVERFAQQLAEAGGAGCIIPDLIPDQAQAWLEISDRYGLDRVFLVSPDSQDHRLHLVSQYTRGFVYAAARMGVTGERQELTSAPATLVERTRAAGAKFVCVGIGVSTPEQAREVAQYADGVIVGSALVHTLLNEQGTVTSEDFKQLETLASSLATAIHNA